MSIENINNRAFLHFSDEVKLHFAFLKVLGFTCVHFDETYVRFESQNLAINICHGRQSYEISLEVESLITSERYSYEAILRLIDRDQAKQYRNYATHTVEGVAEGISQLSYLFRKCINTGILNDITLFSHLKTQRSELAKSYAREIQLEHAYKKSEAAWAEKDFKSVVQALVPLKENLNLTDVKKLEYAKNQISRKGISACC
jgi:hypothetical protein